MWMQSWARVVSFGSIFLSICSTALECIVRFFSPHLRDDCVTHHLHMSNMMRALRALPSRIWDKNCQDNTLENCSNDVAPHRLP